MITGHDKRRAEELYPCKHLAPDNPYRHDAEEKQAVYLAACSEKNEEMEREFSMFTDWCANNGWCFYSGPNMWENKSKNMVHITTTELYQPYKQQKQ